MFASEAELKSRVLTNPTAGTLEQIFALLKLDLDTPRPVVGKYSEHHNSIPAHNVMIDLTARQKPAAQDEEGTKMCKCDRLRSILQLRKSRKFVNYLVLHGIHNPVPLEML